MRILSSFDGDKKVGTSLLHPLETRLKNFLVPLVPAWLQTYHLTLLTIPWCALCVCFSILAEQNEQWLWAVSGVITLQYVTDLLDGEIGRRRNTGLIKWGYYMDHLLDYAFLCSLLIGYFFILPRGLQYFHFFLLGVFGGFMVNSFLAFAATNKFQISYFGIGPTEVRIGFIVVNALLAIIGSTHMAFLQPYLLVASTAGLVITVYRTQRSIWALDMKIRNGG